MENDREIIFAVAHWLTDPKQVLKTIEQEIDDYLSGTSTGVFTFKLTSLGGSVKFTD